MFDEILKMVQDHLAENPAVAAAIPAGQADAIHNETATHITNGVSSAATNDTGGIAGMLGKLESSMASGGSITSAIEGGLVSSLTTKFGLPPSVTGAIAGALPGLLQKFAQKQQ
ncbi:MAG TPA: hypothetical protein VIJ75_14690 [Hanamia sp.]